ncbi:MAG: preprotein translocase subunit SecE [Candidatus Sungbacteria bacterium RIFCSPLOWO2_02_FULL_51_17]|uniref:Protein translocase subunit SecE n=1 Tax=Candidatus Sungbacteria bacterium RIFCSPHIGHO2_02_FULL_51_29 TaxID=1802273 RepID=A0A1G2KVT0_9BACT|nr:MAG: preprotein translocase subunit SecE [Candidatus Sungbacteria bacterium RIFCSPHIGHO2_02_FULL_51_29]OHA12575.1 MAG: preprotein translocase subunit SecE [Candidatus Sungbacteria bacterium RIFCSPLOWO2_02_FULL_51_17]
MLTRIVTFLQDVRTEMRKVTWPTRAQTLQYTIVVIAISLGVAAFLGAWDYVFTQILNRFVL